MGRWDDKCDDHRSIDLAYLRRRGLLCGTPKVLTWSRGGQKTASIGLQANERGVALRYRTRVSHDEWQTVEEFIPFYWTDTRFGGRRQWLACPRCARGCRILYDSGTHYRCRRCLRLQYASQYEAPGLGAVDQAQKIRKRLGDNEGSAFEGDPFPDKPKGMHWQTYRRLEERYDEYQFRWTRTAMARFGFTGL